jgi:hypothetical protein
VVSIEAYAVPAHPGGVNGKARLPVGQALGKALVQQILLESGGDELFVFRQGS